MWAEVPLKPPFPKAQEVLDREVGYFLEGRAQAKGMGTLELCCPWEIRCLMKWADILGAACWPRS